MGLLVGVGLVVRIVAAAPENSREADWKKVDEAVQKGLPKTAIEALQPIIDGALKDKAYPEAIKADRPEDRAGRADPRQQARGADLRGWRRKSPRLPRKCYRC